MSDIFANAKSAFVDYHVQQLEMTLKRAIIYSIVQNASQEDLDKFLVHLLEKQSKPCQTIIK